MARPMIRIAHTKGLMYIWLVLCWRILPGITWKRFTLVCWLSLCNMIVLRISLAFGDRDFIADFIMMFPLSCFDINYARIE